MSNWGAKDLTKKQLTYAAYDAWASVQIVQSLALDLGTIQTTLQEQERSMEEIDKRARARKVAKTNWKQLKELEGEWTPEQRQDFDRYWKIMGDMRPDPPIMLNISLTEQAL